METHRIQPNFPTDCERLAELMPAYALGATDADETRLVESLMQHCPEFQAELKDYAGLAQGLLYSSPTMTPPAALHDKIMAAARTPSQSTSSRVIPIERGRELASPPKTRRITPIVATVASIAAALLLILNISLQLQLGEANLDQVSLQTQISAARFTEQEVRTLLAQRDDVLAAFSGSDVIQNAQLVSTENEAPFANVLYAANFRTGIIIGDNLPAIRDDQTFQLWLIGIDGTPVSMGIFQPDADNRVVYVFESDIPIDTFEVIGVSIEPAGGSPQPTMNPIAATAV